MATAAASDNRFPNYVFIFLLLTTWVAFGLASLWFFRKWKRAMSLAEEQHYYLGLQVVELDTAYADYSGRLIHAEFGLGEAAGDLEFFQDYASSIHYGLVESGGFRRYNEFFAAQNRHMYTTERGNMTSYNVMGGDRRTKLVTEHSTGIHARTDTTDPEPRGHEENEKGEECDMEVDNVVETPVLARLRDLIYECLATQEFADGAAVQQLVLMVLDRGTSGTPLSGDRLGCAFSKNQQSF
jgi:hypothetical protein